MLALEHWDDAVHLHPLQDVDGVEVVVSIWLHRPIDTTIYGHIHQTRTCRII